MRIKNRLAALALLCASVAVTGPALAGAGVAQAAVTQGAHAARTSVSPDIYTTACKPDDNDVHILLDNSIGCVAFTGTGTVGGLDYANAYELIPGIWYGKIIATVGTRNFTFAFSPGQTYSLPEGTIINGVSITKAL